MQTPQNPDQIPAEYADYTRRLITYTTKPPIHISEIERALEKFGAERVVEFRLGDLGTADATCRG